MAKEKRSAADLDAELAALEAELAALEARPRKGKASKPEPAASAREPASATEPALASAEKPEKRGRFALPSIRRKEATSSTPSAAPYPAVWSAPTPLGLSAAESTPPAPRASAADAFDMSVWRQDGDAWVRSVTETPVPVVRRVLDEEGVLVREEPASLRDVDDASGVRAERGIGRLLRRK